MSGKASVPGRGRKPKPVEQKLLAGNPGKRKLNKSAAVPFEHVTNIDAPIWITGYALDMWQRVVPTLCRKKVLTETDLHNVEVFCQAYLNWRQSIEQIAQLGMLVPGKNGLIKNPAYVVQNQAEKAMTSYGAKLGLDPSSRQLVMGGKEEKKANPFAALIHGQS